MSSACGAVSVSVSRWFGWSGFDGGGFWRVLLLLLLGLMVIFGVGVCWESRGVASGSWCVCMVGSCEKSAYVLVWFWFARTLEDLGFVVRNLSAEVLEGIRIRRVESLSLLLGWRLWSIFLWGAVYLDWKESWRKIILGKIMYARTLC